MRQLAFFTLLLVLSLTIVSGKIYAAGCWTDPVSIVAIDDSPGSLTIDPGGNWEVVYDAWDDENNKVRIKYFNSGSPTPVTVVEYQVCFGGPCPPGTIDDLEGLTSARDSTGKLHVAHGIERGATTETFYMYKSASSAWSTPVSIAAIDDSPGSLTIDPSGNWEVVYRLWDDVNSKLRIKYFNSGSPTPVTVVEYPSCIVNCQPGEVYDFEGVTSARDEAGKLHVTYTIESAVDYVDRTYYTYMDDTSVGADYTAQVTHGSVPLTVNFTDQSCGTITSWQWSFGDGAASNAQNPSHTFSKPGTYTVSLTVTGPGGSNTETKTDFISVHAGLSGIPLLLLDD